MLEAGFGQADITPSTGIPLSGFIARENRPSTGIDTCLYVRALALRLDEKLYFLLSYDLLGLGSPLEGQILGRLKQDLGSCFNRENCVLVTTHNHSGPPLGLLCGEAAPEAVYLDLLLTGSVQAARLARESLQPVHLFTAEQRLPGLTYNRRALLPDGRVSISPVPDLPVVERGPLDDRLTVLLFRNLNGDNSVGLVHFACHGVGVLSQSIGADIPGELAGRIGALLGAPCLFLQGAAGDVNPTTVTARRVDLLAWVEHAMELMKDLSERFQMVSGTPIHGSSSQLSLAYAPLPGLEEAERIVRSLEQIADGNGYSSDLQEVIRSLKNTMNMSPEEPLEPAKARFAALALVEAGRKTLSVIRSKDDIPPLPLRITTWRLGDFILVFIAGEIFAITGLRIRSLSASFTVLPVTCMAPLIGYLPDPASLLLGGYEVEDAWRFYGHPAPFEPDSEPRLLHQVAQMVGELLIQKG